MNYTINIDKLINLITIAKGQAHVLPTDVLAKVQISPTNDHSSNYTEPVLRKMFNGLVFMAVYQPYIFYSDNGVEQVDKWCEGLREQIAKGGLPTAFGVISYAIHKQKELTGKHVCHWYGELMMPHA